MNEETIFRGKRKYTGKWIESNNISKQTGMYGKVRIYIGVPVRCEPSSKQVIKWLEVIPETVGEYTGVETDEETTPIFEDDIVKFDDGNVCFTGKVEKGCGAWGIATNDIIPLDYDNACHNNNFISFWEIIWNCDNPDLMLDVVAPYVKIIGNVHDNPELLKN